MHVQPRDRAANETTVAPRYLERKPAGNPGSEVRLTVLVTEVLNLAVAPDAVVA